MAFAGGIGRSVGRAARGHAGCAETETERLPGGKRYVDATRGPGGAGGGPFLQGHPIAQHRRILGGGTTETT